MKEEKCLVSEAMEKCQCKWCKIYRQQRDFQLDWVVKMELNKIYEKVMKDEKR